MNNHDSSRRAGHRARCLLRCVPLVLALSSVQVGATVVLPNGAVGLEPVGGGWAYVDPNGQAGPVFQGRNFAPAASDGSVAVAERYGFGLGNGTSLPVTVSRTLSAGEILTGAVALGAAAYGGCVLGTAISNAAGFGTPSHGSRLTCNALDWLLDVGSDPDPAAMTTYTTNGAYPKSVAKDSCFAWCASYGSSYANRCTFDGSSACKVYWDAAMTSVMATGSTTVASAGNGSNPCPASIDALNPAYSFPGGQPGPDGKCPTGRYNVVTPAVAAQTLATYGNRSANDQLAQDVLNKGGSITTSSPRQVSGPSSLSGPTQTTTKTASNGTQQVTTTTNNYNVTYNNNVVTINQSKTTTNPDGSTETTTQPPQDQCASNPTSAGCAQLGDAGEGTLPTDTKNITFTPVDFGSVAACPAPVAFTAMGRSYMFTYDAMCDTIGSWVRGLVLAVGSFIAAYVFIQGLKS